MAAAACVPVLAGIGYWFTRRCRLDAPQQVPAPAPVVAGSLASSPAASPGS